MKTLDEVIHAFEHCTDPNPDPDYDACAECPYCDAIKGCCRDNSHMTDALHYLKAYKEDRNELTALRAYWKEMHKDVRQKAEVNDENAQSS